MKNSKKITIAAIVVLMVINTVMQAVLPAGEIFMVIATLIILAGASRIVRQFDDLAAEKIFRRAVIAWGLFETIFGPTVLMLLIGAALAAYHYHRKKNAAKEAAKDQETGQ
jgi:predicted membrane protein